MASTAKQKEVKTKWPIVSGLGIDDKHEGRQVNLVPQEGSLVPRRLKKGL